MDKKGIEKKLLATIIIAIIASLAVVGVVYLYVSGIRVDEGFCRFKTTLMTIVPGGSKQGLAWLIGGCNSINERIDGNNWDKCPEEIKKQFDGCKKSSSTGGGLVQSAFVGAASADITAGEAIPATNKEICQLDAQQECAAYQFAKLVERCAWMYGGGNSYRGTTYGATVEDCSNYQCYSVKVLDTGGRLDFAEMSKKYITSDIIDADYVKGHVYFDVDENSGACKLSGGKIKTDKIHINYQDGRGAGGVDDAICVKC